MIYTSKASMNNFSWVNSNIHKIQFPLSSVNKSPLHHRAPLHHDIPAQSERAQHSLEINFFLLSLLVKVEDTTHHIHCLELSWSLVIVQVRRDISSIRNRALIAQCYHQFSRLDEREKFNRRTIKLTWYSWLFSISCLVDGWLRTRQEWYVDILNYCSITVQLQLRYLELWEQEAVKHSRLDVEIKSKSKMVRNRREIFTLKFKELVMTSARVRHKKNQISKSSTRFNALEISDFIEFSMLIQQPRETKFSACLIYNGQHTFFCNDY